ncbi:NUDIX domain-containing protein [Alphaproteobacteria bacterium KMM 3653]|uniref:ADP-ribose pyrophosphatase n=1 Tax=Harenicola maris TaxID=2841044 RepID=A0AAP2G308_9RHOB|nr:NUDIX domain-containing protein [Harenicola maris]
MACEGMLTQVLGAVPEARAHEVAGFKAMFAHGGRMAALEAQEGASVSGLLADLDDEQFTRLRFFAEGAGAEFKEAPLPTFAAAQGEGIAFDEGGWRAKWAELMAGAARSFMPLYGRAAHHPLPLVFGQCLARAQAQINAREPLPTTLRRAGRPDDVEVIELATPYRGFFGVEELTFRQRRFDGGQSPVLNRAAFISGDAATVLPYDPRRDRVLLVEQYRFGPLMRGDPNPWQLEAIAGRIDGGESAETCALREAVEEAGIKIDRMIRLPGGYPSPAAKTEFLHNFIGIADIPDDAAGSGGLETEDEDIRSHILSFDALMALLDSGELAVAPLALSALHLYRMRDGLRSAANG